MEDIAHLLTMLQKKKRYAYSNYTCTMEHAVLYCYMLFYAATCRKLYESKLDTLYQESI